MGSHVGYFQHLETTNYRRFVVFSAPLRGKSPNTPINKANVSPSFLIGKIKVKNTFNIPHKTVFGWVFFLKDADKSYMFLSRRN